MPKSTCEETVAEYFSALRSGDVERWVNTFAVDGVTHDPVGTPPHRGHEEIAEFLTGIYSHFDHLQLTEDHVFVAGNSAAVKWTGSGVGKNGRSVAFEGVDVLDCDAEGKITLVRAFWDPGPVMRAVQS